MAFVVAGVQSPLVAEDVTDVTSKVVAAVRDNRLSIKAGNDTFGDPAPGIPKKLFIEYRIGDEKLKREVG